MLQGERFRCNCLEFEVATYPEGPSTVPNNSVLWIWAIVSV